MGVKEVVGFVSSVDVGATFAGIADLLHPRGANILDRVHHAPCTGVGRWTAVAGLALAAVTASCSQSVVHRMVPPPIVIQDKRLDFSRAVLPGTGTHVSVLFATTRAPAPPESPEHYARGAGEALRVGIARVRLGEPNWSFDDLVKSDRTASAETPRPARVMNVQEFGPFGAPGGEAERAFVAEIDRQAVHSPDGSVVIYVPGYRATFDQVMILMGSWAHFLRRYSTVIAFSWPTGTRFWNYLFDCRRARAYVPDIARLIALVAEQSQVRRINLIAFSCGGPLLAEALVELRQSHPEEGRAALQRRYRIANGIFIAADIDLRTFARSHLPVLLDIEERTEVYLSKNDAALRFAALLARASRLGRPHFKELTREELETLASNKRLVTIDVTGVEARFNRSLQRRSRFPSYFPKVFNAVQSDAYASEGRVRFGVVRRISLSASAGVRHSSVLRGRVLSASATALSSLVPCTLRSVPFGKYCRNSPFVFSFVPRCHGLCGSQK